MVMDGVTLIKIFCFVISATSFQFAHSAIPNSSTEKLQRFQFRVTLLHQVLLEENCIEDLPVRASRDISVYEILEQLEIEMALYYHLLGLLSACRETRQDKTTTIQSPDLSQITTTSVTEPTTTQGGICRDGYKLNPITSTCIRLVVQRVNWETAKALCEADREKLAVFPSLESVQWLDSVLRNPENNAEWGRDWPWIGLRPVDGVWRWQGRITSSVSTSDTIWNKIHLQPTKSDGTECGCVTGLYDNSYKKIWDCNCRQTYSFICEIA